MEQTPQRPEKELAVELGSDQGSMDLTSKEVTDELGCSDASVEPDGKEVTDEPGNSEVAVELENNHSPVQLNDSQAPVEASIIKALPIFNPADVSAAATNTEASLLTPEVSLKITKRIEKAQKRHNTWVDSVLFNGLTVLVLLLTAGAAFIPSLGDGVPKWIAPLFAGLAGAFVAMERALGFGARWRYHRDMYYGYDAILDMLDFYPAIPPSERGKYVRDIFTALYALRSRESAIPNAGTNSSPT